MSFFQDLKAFDRSALRETETTVRHLGFVQDTSPDEKIADAWEGRLFLGSQDGAANLEELKNHGITHILNCGVQIDNFFPEQFVYKNIEILDNPDTDLLNSTVFEDAIAFAKEALHSQVVERKDGRLFVHCNAGVSRSTTLVLAIMKHFDPNLTLEQALAQVRMNRPSARPNDGFMAQLNQFYRDK